MADKVRVILAANLKRYCVSFGYSQMKIASVSTSLIASIETHKKFPSSTSINKLSQAFSIEPYELFKEESSTIDKSAKLGALKEEL
ncbi:MAG: helix-turn-helix transcriptional regulator [Spirochaetales bacterium]|nr:helix-turn-helix transcriptional regulator [Spirochaetales bacterium]